MVIGIISVKREDHSNRYFWNTFQILKNKTNATIKSNYVEYLLDQNQAYRSTQSNMNILHFYHKSKKLWTLWSNMKYTRSEERHTKGGRTFPI